MSDIDIFDPIAFFDGKVRELEQELIGKKARVEILLANRTNLERTLETLGALAEAQQRALQVEMASLTEARNQAARTIDMLYEEMAALAAKLSALKAARLLVEHEVGCTPRAAGD